MEEVWKRIKELSEMVERGYKSTSIINSDKRILEPSFEDGGDFVQFASNQIIPRWIFEGTADNSMVAYEFSNSLRLSEIKYLLKKIKESYPETDTLNEVTYEEFLRILTPLRKPTDIFIPIKIFVDMHRFYSEAIFERDSHYTYLKVGDNKIRMHWSNKLLPFNEIFILEESGVTWLQKRVKDMTVSMARDPPGIKLLTKKDDILQISVKISDANSVNFLMRLVAKAEVDKEKVKIVNLSKHLR